MAVKHYVDEIPPSTGRVYQIINNGNTAKINDVTDYQQIGTGFGASDVNSACVLECNYEKVGTVHKLSTENTASENIKFFATADFNEGDTFTFNDTEVTARTISGQALGEEHFKANTVVKCSKRGNILYFEGSSGKSSSIIDDTTGEAYRLGVENGNLYLENETGAGEKTKLAAATTPTTFSLEASAFSELAEQFAGCGYSAEIAAEGVTAADFPDVYFDGASIENATAAGILAATADGKIVIYAKKIPEGALSGSYFIRKGAVSE